MEMKCVLYSIILNTFYLALVFAQRFLDRVEETFINRNEHHKFVEFLEILRNFRENQPQKSGADLYLVSILLTNRLI